MQTPTSTEPLRLSRDQIDAIVAKYERRAPKRFRARPVRNFLETIDNDMHAHDCFSNCTMDSRSYGWHVSIVNAIREGITLLFSGRRS